jgi:ABC-2 type transport system ATP-binding protein
MVIYQIQKADFHPRMPPQTDTHTPAISTHGLARSFGSMAAVRSLDLTVHRGKMFGLVGPDGAGKSTAIRLLCGILKHTGGEGRVLGDDLKREAEKIKSRIGYLSQNFTLYGDLTVDENIEFFAELHGVRNYQKRRDELLEFTRLTAFRRRLGQDLSGGMKKKLALASTLIHTPDLIFLDEPSTGVDPVSRGEFWNILSDLLEQGVTIFMTTPYLDEAERCHRISLMHHGKLIRTGTPDEVRSAFPGKVFSIQCPDPSAAYHALREKWPSTRLVLFCDRVHFWSCEAEKELQIALAWLDTKGMGPVTFSETAPSLEDVFVAMLGEGAQHTEKATSAEPVQLKP